MFLGTEQKNIIKFHIKTGKNGKNLLTYGYKRCIIYKHELSEEAECGYILRIRKNGGNFGGVCHGKDQAVSFIKIALIPELTCMFWEFI